MKATEFEAIAKWAGDNDKKIIAQVLNGLDFVPDMRVIRNVSGHGMLLPKMTVAKGIRPLDLAIENPNATNRTFSGRKLFAYPFMKIITMIPEEVRASFADRGLDPKATEIPLAQFVWEGEFAKIASELNDSAYLNEYHGDAADFDAGVDYALGAYVVFGEHRNIYKAIADPAAGESPATHPAKWEEVNSMVIADGIGTIIAEEITATNITPIVTGAIDNTNALDKIELMYKDMTAAHRKLGGVVRVGADVFRAYIEHEKAEFPNAANPDFGDGRKYVYGSGKKWEIREANWMGDSGRVIMTQKENLVFGTNLESDQNKIANIIKTLHGYKAIVKGLAGFQISDLETLYVNDQP
jgi:hypothetical protein